MAALEQLNQTLDADGIAFVVARLKGPMRDSFNTSGLTQKIVEERFFATVHDGVAVAGEGTQPAS